MNDRDIDYEQYERECAANGTLPLKYNIWLKHWEEDHAEDNVLPDDAFPTDAYDRFKNGEQPDNTIDWGEEDCSGDDDCRDDDFGAEEDEARGYGFCDRCGYSHYGYGDCMNPDA